MRMAGVRDLFALVNVFAGDAVPGVAGRTFAALERAIGEAVALGASEAWTGETTVCTGEDVVSKNGRRVVFVSSFISYSNLNTYQWGIPACCTLET